MNKEINLLDYKSKISISQKNTLNRPLRIIAASLLFLVSAFSVVLFILIALSPLPQLTKQKNEAEIELSQSIGNIVRLGLINDRVNSINQILKNRSQHDEFLNYVQSSLPTGVTINSFRISNNTLTVDVNSSSLSSLNNFINSIIEKKADGAIKDIQLSNLSIDQQKNTFVMTLSIKKL